MFRLGLDMHGVVDAAPEFFSTLSERLLKDGHKVHIVTGREDTKELQDEITACGMQDRYSSILSITSYQKQLGTPVCYLDGDPTQPMMDPQLWNQSKSILCATAGIDIMIDDSVLYEPSFRDIKAQYIIYTPAIQEFLNFLFYRGGIDLAAR